MNIKTFMYEKACKSEEDFIEAIRITRENAIEECIELSDEIELREPDGGVSQWIAFKAFRNTMRDRIKNEITPVTKWIKHEVPAKTLEWGRVSDTKMTWEEADKWCKEQGGRLPTSLELLQAYFDKIDGFNESAFWSATAYPYTGLRYDAMIVFFNVGSVYSGNKTFSQYVRCVQG